MTPATGTGSARRYSTLVVARAKEHVAAGWSASRTCELLESEFGVKPHISTVRCWTDARYARRFATRNREKSRREHTRRVGRKPLTRVSAEWRQERMRELHDAGLSFAAIGAVAGIWWGEPLSEKTVAARLRRKPRVRSYRRKGGVT